MRVVIDIETVGYDFEALSDSQQEYILRYAEKEKDNDLKDQKIDDAKRYLSLYPFTSKIVAIGFYDIDRKTGIVVYEGSGEEWHSEEKNMKYRPYSEEEMIKFFWKIVKDAKQIITFNGRNFDIPFLRLRSAIKRIVPSVNLQLFKNHVDLLDEFTQYGKIRKFNLDFYCQSFGVKTPKTDVVNGMEVKNLYNAGRINDIAQYCGDDIIATKELFEIWQNYFHI